MAWTERFACIGSVDPERPETWDGKLFLTLDIEWAINPVVELFLDLLDDAKIPATIFVTHASPTIERIRKNPRHELGVHPNFNDLNVASLDGARAVLSRLKELVPEARCIRSHTLTQSSRLVNLFLDMGFTHDGNHFIPATAGITLKPYRDWNGIIRVPYLWEDYVELFRPTGPESSIDLTHALRARGLRVFNFHPIQVALNSPNIALYENTRSIHHDWTALQRARFAGRGVADLFREFLAAGRD